MKKLILILFFLPLLALGQTKTADIFRAKISVKTPLLILNGLSYSLIPIGETNATTYSTRIGLETGYSASESENVFIGYQTGKAITDGADNVFVGFQAGLDNTSGYANNFVGAYSGENNISGTINQFFGNNSGAAITTGSNNLFLGAYSGANLKTSSNRLVIDNLNRSDSTGLETKSLIVGTFNAMAASQTVVINAATTVNNTIKSTSYLMQQGIYAGIYVNDGSTAQSIANGVTYIKSTAFTTNGLDENCTSDAANDKITITKTGKYMVLGTCSFTCGTNNVVWYSAAFLGGTEQPNIHWARKVGTGADLGSASFMGIINVASVPVDLDVRFRHDQVAAVDLTILYSNLTVNYIGE